MGIDMNLFYKLYHLYPTSLNCDLCSIFDKTYISVLKRLKKSKYIYF